MSTPTPDQGRRAAIVREDTGAVRIGTLPAGPAGRVTLTVPGATLFLDPTAIGALPAAVVGDPDDAHGTIDRIYGPAAADALAGATEEASEVAVVGTDAARRLARLAAVRWLQSNGSAPLDPAMLTLEQAVRAVECQDLLDDENPVAGLTALLPAVLGLSRALRSAPRDAAGPAFEPDLAALVGEAVDQLLLDLPVDAAAAEELRHEADLSTAMAHFDLSGLDWDALSRLAEQARPRAALDAGEPVSPAEGRASVDWNRVPRGLLDPSEGTVAWSMTARPDGGARFNVQVAGLAPRTGGLFRLLQDADPVAARQVTQLERPPSPDELGFRLYALPFGLPLGSGRLRPGPGGRVWQGSTDLPPEVLAAGPLVIDIHDRATRTGPRVGAIATAAEAHRWAARGVGLVRLSLAGAGGEAEPEAARAPLERARQLFGALAAGTGRAADLARRRQVRCDALLAAYLYRHGQTRAGDRAARRVTALRDQVADVDAQPPDLTHPAWQPGPTELAWLRAGDLDAG